MLDIVNIVRTSPGSERLDMSRISIEFKKNKKKMKANRDMNF